jgi:aminoglycoside phosphotransferase (APT) family kinase protein
MSELPSLLTKDTEDWVLSLYPEGSELTDIHELKGSTTARMISFKVKIRSSEADKELVLREYEDPRFTAEDILHEKYALQQAASLRIPVPEVIRADPYGLANSKPMILMTALKGDVNLTSSHHGHWLENLAKTLCRLHDNSVKEGDYRYARYQDPVAFQLPQWTHFPEVWEALKEIAQLPEPEAAKVFIHRDFHPANVLWENNQVTGVVDWMNACVGPKSVDLGHCRWNLAMLYGTRSADDFLMYYLRNAASSFEYNVYWDIVSLLDVLEDSARISVYPGWEVFGKSDITEEMMRKRMDDYAQSLLSRFRAIDV